MPRGDKSAYTDKQKRQAEHIEDGYRDRGVPEDDAELRLIRDQEVRLKRADAFRAPAHLGGRLLARHVEDGAAPARRRRARGLSGHVQQQR